jgi:heme exporter protein C
MMQTNQKTPGFLILFDILAIAGLSAAFLLVLYYAPIEQEMGVVQKVFYFHVAAAWTGMLGFTVATVTAIAYLRTSNLKWDIAGVAGVEIGMVFMAIAIVSGSIWARPIWNTWWTWDPRLTTTLVMELLYAAYFLLRSGVDDLKRRARYAAVYAIAGFASVPLTFISIRIFRTIHPVLVGPGSSGTGSFAMSDKMLIAFFASLVAFSLLFIALYWHRIRLGSLTRVLETMRSTLDDEINA